MTAAATRLLSLWRDPPDWIVWARPTTEAERREIARPVDLVITIDVGESGGPETVSPRQATHAPRVDYGICDIGVGVRWYDERREPNVATFALTRDAHGVTPWMAWLRDVRRDLRRRAHGHVYERGSILVLDAREVGRG